jgi:murein DD-endopeptidase MepM/ murein hydrolase activator NlpD
MKPVSPACVSSPFGPRVLPNRPLAGTFHPGIDLPAPEHTPVRAIAPGQILRVQQHGPGGLEILIDHAGFIGVYSHLGRIAPLIAAGRQTVHGGQTIGTVGNTGVSYGMHLYFGMIVNGQAVDPAVYLTVPSCGVPQRDSSANREIRLPPSRIYAGR